MRHFILGALVLLGGISTTSAQIIVHTGDNLKAIVNNAPSGAVIEIQSDATFKYDLSIGESAPQDLTIRAGVGFAPKLLGKTVAAVTIGHHQQTVLLEGLALASAPSAPTPRSVYVSGNSPTGETVLVRLLDCNLTDDLGISGTNTATVRIEADGCQIDGRINPAGTGSLTIDLDIRNSTIGQYYTNTIGSIQLTALLEDCVINGVIDEYGSNLSSDLTVRRSKIFGNTSYRSGGAPTDHKATFESCLFVGDGSVSAGLGVTNNAGTSAASVELLNCTVTGFVTGADFDGSGNVWNSLFFGNGTDIAFTTPKSSVFSTMTVDGFAASQNGNLSGAAQVDAHYALLFGTLGLDAGDNTLAIAGSTDLFGNPRFMDLDCDGIATVNVGAVERPGGADATVTAFNGNNPGGFTAEPAVLGAMFKGVVAKTPTTILTVMAVDAPAPFAFQIPGWTGDVLVAASPLLILDFANGNHFVPVPADCNLVGGMIAAQGARIDLNGPLLDVILLNRLDFTLGF
jgi:hypothetical protein